MDLETLEKMAKTVQKDVEGLSLGLRIYRAKEAEVKNLIAIASKMLPDHEEFFKSVSKKLVDFDNIDIRHTLEHIMEIIQIEKSSQAKVKEMKIFESAEDKMKQAELSFRKDDYPSTFHNLNTALELVLKDKLGIPTTITKINTSKIVDILVKHKIDPYLYVDEARKRILTIDNKIKHQGYSPSKVDCINGIKAMEELISRLRDKEIKLIEEIRNKIYQGL